MTRTLQCILAGIFLVYAMAWCPAGDFIAGYHLDGRYLLLGEGMEDPETGGLVAFDLLPPEGIATIFHEMWHAWFLEVETPRQGEIYAAFRNKVDGLYPDFPPDKRMEVHEEAVADFIDALVATSIQMRRFLARQSPERRREILTQTAYMNIYARLFEDSYTGYFTRSISATLHDSATTITAEIPPVFIRDAESVLRGFIDAAAAEGLPTGYIEETIPHLQGVVFINDFGWPIAPRQTVPAAVDAPATLSPPPARPADFGQILSGLGEWMRRLLLTGGEAVLRADVVMSDIPLDREDMDLIGGTVLEGRFPPDPKKALRKGIFRGLVRE